LSRSQYLHSFTLILAKRLWLIGGYIYSMPEIRRAKMWGLWSMNLGE